MSNPEDLRPASHQEAEDIIANDSALQKATTRADDPETDDDARTPDTAPAGETRD